MPTPKRDESHDDFIRRCIPIVIRDGTAEDGAQGRAVCESMWKRSKQAREKSMKREQVTPWSTAEERQQHRYVRMTGLADGAALRTATFDGAEHLVVPVVALVGNVVVRPLGADGPEFVPAEELAVAPAGWNGRPVVPDHPDGGRASANEPHTLETRAFGRLFNTRFEDNRLRTEAWLEVERAARIGGDAVAVITRCRAGEMVEVSVGAFVTLVPTAGTTVNGERYSVAWSDIVPDHLAMLPEEAEGACSIEMGCGAPRVNRRAELRAVEQEEERMSKTTFDLTARVPEILRRALVTLGFKGVQDDGVSDAQLRERLHDALRAIEPGYQGIAEVFPEAGLVVYVTMPGDEPLFWRRAYAMADGGDVMLSDDARHVEPVTRFEPVESDDDDSAMIDSSTDTAETVATARAAGCACTTETNDDRGEHDMSGDVQEMVGRLVAHAASPFTDDDDVEALAALGADCLERMLAQCDEHDTRLQQAEAEVATANDKVAAIEAAMADEKKWLAAAPASIRSMVERYQAEEEERRAELIAACGDLAIDSDELSAMPTPTLAKLAAALRPRDYGSRPRSVEDDLDSHAPPDPYDLAGANKRKEAN